MILILHAAVTWALVGLILTIQLVHYPLFSRWVNPAGLPTNANTRTGSPGWSAR
ncbi:hypothetical protein Q0M94_15005 [Deinococcus radiomollis]|uniref:hypothetical protein n=1 Tax=Deinococcus radiomollis TaxID=468916 RepID=UPI0038912882